MSEACRLAMKTESDIWDHAQEQSSIVGYFAGYGHKDQVSTFGTNAERRSHGAVTSLSAVSCEVARL